MVISQISCLLTIHGCDTMTEEKSFLFWTIFTQAGAIIVIGLSQFVAIPLEIVFCFLIVFVSIFFYTELYKPLRESANKHKMKNELK